MHDATTIAPETIAREVARSTPLPVETVGKSIWRDLIEIALLVLIFGWGAHQAIQTFRVDGHSMDPDFHNNELIVVDKLSYLVDGGPQRGDVIVFHYPLDTTQVFIKRVMGVPGDTLALSNGYVVLNGHTLHEPYVMATINTAQYGDGPLVDGASRRANTTSWATTATTPTIRASSASCPPAT